MANTEKSFPIRVDLTGEDAIVQGAEWYRMFLFTYTDDGETWETWPDDTYDGVMTVKADYDSEPIIEATTDNGMVTVGEQGTDPHKYTIQIALPSSVTEALEPWGRGVWDLFVIDSLGHRTMVCKGIAELKRMVMEV